MQHPKSVWLFLAFLTVNAVVGCESRTVEPVRQPVVLTLEEEERHAKAVAAIERIGGKVEESPDGELMVDLSRATHTNDDLACLKDLHDLRGLFVQDAHVTDAGLQHLRGLKDLRVLSLTSPKLTDAGLQHLKGLDNLERLWLANGFTDTGLVYLKELPNLKFLEFANVEVTDAGLVHLETLPNLSRLNLVQTLVTQAGVSRLKKVLPRCEVRFTPRPMTERDVHVLTPERQAAIDAIEKLGGKFSGIFSKRSSRVDGVYLINLAVTEDTLMHLQILKEVEHLHLDDTPTTDAGLKHLRGLKDLWLLNVSGTQVSDTGLEQLEGLTNLKSLYLCRTRVSDAGLAHLTGLVNLKKLDLRGTQVTDEGVKKLQEALPKCEIGH